MSIKANGDVDSLASAVGDMRVQEAPKNEWVVKQVSLEVGCRSVTVTAQEVPKDATHCRYECSGEDKVKKRPGNQCWMVCIVVPVKDGVVGSATFTTLIPNSNYRLRLQWSNDNQATWGEWTRHTETVTLPDPWGKFVEADYTLDQKYDMIRNVIKLPKSACAEASRRLFGKDWIASLDDPVKEYINSFSGEVSVAGKHVRRYDGTHIAELCRAIFNLGRHGNQPGTPDAVKRVLFGNENADEWESEHFDGRPMTLKYFSSKYSSLLEEIWSIEKANGGSMNNAMYAATGNGIQYNVDGTPIEGSSVQIEVQVVPYAAGLVIGKGGETIKEIQRATNTRIVSPLPEVPVKIFAVAGHPTDVEAARWQIKEKEKAWLVTQLTPPPSTQLIYWHPFIINIFHQGAALPYGTFRLDRNLVDGSGVLLVVDQYGEEILSIPICHPVHAVLKNREEVNFVINVDNVAHYFVMVDGQPDPTMRAHEADFLCQLFNHFRVRLTTEGSS